MSGNRPPYPNVPPSTPGSGVPSVPSGPAPYPQQYGSPQQVSPQPANPQQGNPPQYASPQQVQPQQVQPQQVPPQQASPQSPPYPYSHQNPHQSPGPLQMPPPSAPGLPTNQGMSPNAYMQALPPLSRQPTLPSSHPAMAAQALQAMQNMHGMQTPATTMIPVQFPQAGAVLVSTRGTYAVQSVIGSGEFGAVYECSGPFDQVYAMKMVRPANRPYAEVQQEWAKEVQRLLSLRHPNVVYIYDAFEQGHLFYLALERCDHALSAMLGTPMQEGLVIELARQLLAAVQFLHDNDVVHDDLHPGNVLIEHDTDRPIVKISDFGISHELRGQPAIRPNVVHHAIMAPEILATGYTSKQSDLYQVGLLLYWMLTGAPAVDMKAAYNDLVRQVSDGEPRKRAEAIGTPLGSLIAKMLRRREAYRYTSAREVWADLRSLPAWQKRALFPVR